MTFFQRLALTCFVSFSMRGVACQCPLVPLTLEGLSRYEVIFRGTILSVRECGDRPGEAVFQVSELYRGNVTEHFNIVFDCKDECAQPMLAGDEWIIYANYQQVSTGRLDWCSRSRKHFAISREDFYKVNYGNDYEDEIAYLRKALGQHRLMASRPGEGHERNIRPNLLQTSVILLCSIAGMVLFYYLFRKFFRRL